MMQQKKSAHGRLIPGSSIFLQLVTISQAWQMCSGCRRRVEHQWRYSKNPIPMNILRLHHQTEAPLYSVRAAWLPGSGGAKVTVTSTNRRYGYGKRKEI